MIAIKKYFLIIFCLTFSIASFCEEEKETKVRFSGVPALSFDSDSGFGGGLVGSMYLDQKDLKPYKMAIDGQIFMTTKWVQSHEIRVDALRVFELPLRLIGRVGFYSTLSQNYCGPGNDSDCSDERAENRARELGLSGDERTEFLRTYYLNRYMSVYGGLQARWLLWQRVAKLELMARYAGRYYMNRDFKNTGPYPNSLYGDDFKNMRLDGYLSTLELGVMLDKRDNEPAPTSGYWLEGSVRGASKIFGSAWEYIGGNIAGRFYFPFDADRKLIFANQTVLDLIHGDLPYDAISRVGGSQAMFDYKGMGGKYIGRGIRDQRFVGRIKAYDQAEFRYNFYSFGFWKQEFDLTAAAFGDFMMNAWDFDRFKEDMQNVYIGFGGGLRIHWNKAFVVRVDLATSPNENFSLKYYLTVGNIF